MILGVVLEVTLWEAAGMAYASAQAVETTTPHAPTPTAAPPQQPGGVGLVVLGLCAAVILAGAGALFVRYRGSGPGGANGTKDR